MFKMQNNSHVEERPKQKKKTKTKQKKACKQKSTLLASHCAC